MYQSMYAYIGYGVKKNHQHLPQQVLGPWARRRQQMYLMLAMFIHGDTGVGNCPILGILDITL